MVPVYTPLSLNSVYIQPILDRMWINSAIARARPRRARTCILWSKCLIKCRRLFPLCGRHAHFLALLSLPPADIDQWVNNKYAAIIRLSNSIMFDKCQHAAWSTEETVCRAACLQTELVLPLELFTTQTQCGYSAQSHPNFSQAPFTILANKPWVMDDNATSSCNVLK